MTIFNEISFFHLYRLFSQENNAYLGISDWKVCNYVQLKESLSKEVTHLGFLLQFRFNNISRGFHHVNMNFFFNIYSSSNFFLILLIN